MKSLTMCLCLETLMKVGDETWTHISVQNFNYLNHSAIQTLFNVQVLENKKMSKIMQLYVIKILINDINLLYVL